MKIQKSEKTQLRIEMGDYNGKTFVNLREWYESESEYKPTKKGVTFGPEFLPQVIEELQKLQALSAKSVKAVKDNRAAWIIAEDKQAAMFHRSTIFSSPEKALRKTPSKGFIFQVEIKDGVITHANALYKMVNGEWKKRKPPTD